MTPDTESAAAISTKPTNPKDAVGILKAPISTVPTAVMFEVGVAMLEGARKYGRHNYRVMGVRAGVYVDAAARHLGAWWEGEDIDPDSGLSHIVKAISSLVVLRDAMLNAKLTDDRPPPLPRGWMDDLNRRVAIINAKHPHPPAPFTAETNNAIQNKD
ncbi:MAG: dATP/dGTP diphosphohydrolase domain-containing protein [Rhodospirillaceae bacterium]|nr:dATP/dGTP diphosphohydrolase domain-containing protein [Rhodospirillaceae bacterium]